MLKRLFPLSFRQGGAKQMLLSLVLYLAIALIGSLIRGATIYFGFLPSVGGIIGVIANVYAFIGLALLAVQYLNPNK